MHSLLRKAACLIAFAVAACLPLRAQTAPVAFTGNLTSGSAVVASVSSTVGLVVGTQVVSCTGCPPDATIASIGSGTITLSAAATATASSVAMVAQAAQPGFTLLFSQHVYDLHGAPLASGQFKVSPVTNAGAPVGFSVGGIGQATVTPYQWPVVNGVIVTDGTFIPGTSTPIAPQLPNTASTFPVNVCFSAQIVAANTGRNILGPGYGCLQPAGATWSFDTFQPNQPGQVTVQTGPTGPTGPAGTNGTNGTNGADGTMTGAQTTSLIGANFQRNINLFDQTLITANTALGLCAATASSSGNFVTGMVPVYAGGYVEYNHNPYQNSGYGASFYDATGACVSSTNSGAANTAIAVPATAVSFRGTFYTADGSASLMVISTPSGVTPTMPGSYIGFGTVDPITVAAGLASTLATAVSDIAASASTQLLQTINLIGSHALLNTNNFNQQLISSNLANSLCGGAPVTSTGQFMTGLVPVYPGGSIEFNHNSYGNTFYGSSFYDALGNCVGSFSTTSANTVVAVPATAIYLRGTFWIVDGVSTLMIISTPSGTTPTMPGTYVAFGGVDAGTVATMISAAISTAMPGYGKHIGVFGDSICQLYSSLWLPTVEARTGATVTFQDCHSGRPAMNAFENYDVGSAAPNGTSSGISANGSLTTGNTLATDMAGVDMMLVELNTNDCDYVGVNVGTTGEAANNSGDLTAVDAYVIQTLLAAKPTLKIIWLTPYQDNPANGHGGCTSAANSATLNAALVPAIHYWAIPVADGYSDSGIGPSTWSTYLVDGLHAGTTAGGIVLGSLIAGVMNMHF